MAFRLAEKWYERRNITGDITLIYEPYVHPFLRCNIWHLKGRDKDQQNATLFSGDALYDGQLLDDLPDSSIPDYIHTMKRLRSLPVDVVHGGHEPSFGRERMIELMDAYLDRREGQAV